MNHSLPSNTPVNGQICTFIYCLIINLYSVDYIRRYHYNTPHASGVGEYNIITVLTLKICFDPGYIVTRQDGKDAHLNSNNILIDNQHGFRSHYSCAAQLISLVEDLMYAMDHQKQTVVILLTVLDFVKAFDSVSHQRLLMKLKHYGIHDSICKWIGTWLT